MNKANRTEKIGTREFTSIILLMIGMKFVDMTPAMLSQTGQNAFWMIPFISFLVFFPSFLLMLYLLKQYKDKNLIELINHLLGKYVGFFVGFILFLIAFTGTVVDSRSYVDELGTMYFPKSSLLYLYVVFMLAAYFGAKRGLEAIGTTVWIVIPYIKISIAILLLLLLREAVFMRIFPLFGPGIDVLVVEGVKKASIFSDLIGLGIAYTAVKDGGFRKGSIIGSIIVLIEIIAFFLIYSLIFDYRSIDKVSYPFHEVARYVSIGSFFTNVETFYLVFWLLGAILRFVLYLYFTTWTFAAVFKIKEFEKLLLPIGFISLSVGMLPENPLETVFVIRESFLNIVSAITLPLPLLLWLVAKGKGELKSEKSLRN